MLALDVVFFVIHARCNVAVLAVSNLTCSFSPPLPSPPLHPALQCTAVGLYVCAPSTPEVSLRHNLANRFPLLPLGPFLFLLDLPLMFTTFILYCVLCSLLYMFWFRCLNSLNGACFFYLLSLGVTMPHRSDFAVTWASSRAASTFIWFWLAFIRKKIQQLKASSALQCHSFFTQIYVCTLVIFYFNLIGKLLLIMQEIRAPEVKVDAQNVVRRQMADELNRGGINYSVIDEWHAQMRLWGKAMRYLSANTLVMRYLEINNWTACVSLFLCVVACFRNRTPKCTLLLWRG